MVKQVFESDIDRQNIDNVHITQVAVALHSDLYILLRAVDTALLHNLTGKVVALMSLFFTETSTPDKPNPVISEVLKHAESQCDNFVPTLLLFSQLLPMPLPIIVPKDTPENSKEAALSSYKLWSTIITPHVEELTSFLLPLSSSISRPLLEVVIILVQQVIDLSPSIALPVVKKFIEETSPLLVNTILENKTEGEGEEVKDVEEEQKELLMLSSEQITAILTFAEILTLPAAKAAMISCLSNEGEGVMDLWMYASYAETPDEDVAAALLLASVLVDLNLCLLPVTDDIASVANAFPPTFHLKAIVDLAVKKIDSRSALVISRVFLVLGLLQRNRYVSSVCYLFVYYQAKPFNTLAV